MRHFVRVLVAVTSLLTVTLLSLVIPASGPGSEALAAARTGGGTAATDVAYVQRLLFEVSIGEFATASKGRRGPDGRAGDIWFEWETDLCSAPLVGNTGRSFNFTESCRRHDFGYRNSQLIDNRYGRGTAWNGDARKRIDQQFLADMKRHCAGRRLIDRPTCYSWAFTFYSAVRIAGGP